MKAGRVRTTMEEECREILQSVEEALAREMQQEMRGGPGCARPDGARIAACLHLQRAALRSVTMQSTGRNGNRHFGRPALSGSAIRELELR